MFFLRNSRILSHMLQFRSGYLSVFVFTLSLLLSFSCASRQDVVYFQDTLEYEVETDINNKSQTRFKIDDLISIYVSTLNPEASTPFNLFRGTSEGGLSPEPVDYLVDKNGEIEFPVIGKIKAAGLTPEELRLFLINELSDYLKDPIINIRLRNFTVTILGEVNRPGTYPVPSEQITILEALGLAGDMTIQGIRNNILVIRDLDGTKVYERVDLTSKDAFRSPGYFLNQNDVVYVEPNKTAIKSSSVGSNTALIFSVISLLITTTVVIVTRS